MLVSLPGVTADNGTARGIGVSVTGARPSSSNYLLDGVENNNYLVTGPLSPVAPEAVQEYRISTNNYSAEYGQTAGFVANAVTKAGGNEFHGIAYDYFKNTVLNAADFADNLSGYGRLPDKEQQFGYQAGGPILKNRLFFSSALEQLISHSNQNPQTYTLPSANFISAFNLPVTNLARQLLQEYPGPVINTLNVTGSYTVAQPVVVDRLIALERGDYTTNGGRDHLMARLAIQRLSQPDFIWSPYPAFTSGLHDNTTGIAGNWMHTWTPRVTSELKANYSDDTLWWNRAHPEIPTLVSGDGAVLPGSPAFYAYRNHNRTLQGIYSTIWTRNKHIVTAGAGVLFRYNDGYLTAGRDGEYIFSGIVNFAFGDPQYFRASIERPSLLTSSGAPTQPDFNRNYYYPQTYFFAQDSFRVLPRLTLNYGVRYDNFGVPQNTGSAKDALLQPGTGADFNARLASASLLQPNSGNEKLSAPITAIGRPASVSRGIRWARAGRSSAADTASSMTRRSTTFGRTSAITTLCCLSIPFRRRAAPTIWRRSRPCFHPTQTNRRLRIFLESRLSIRSCATAMRRTSFWECSNRWERTSRLKSMARERWDGGLSPPTS